MAKVPQTPEARRKQLESQLGFLASSMKAYDAGETEEYRRLAVAIRILVHHQGNSHALLHQIGMSEIAVRSYSARRHPRQVGSHFGIVQIETGPQRSRYRPVLRGGPIKARPMRLDDWWNESVISVDGLDMVDFSRKRLAKTVADQDGGAHVDPSIEADYAALVAGAGGHMRVAEGVESMIPEIERAAIRHIAFELWEAISRELVRIDGNLRCGCGSGRKARYCHDRETLKERSQGIETSPLGDSAPVPKGGFVSFGSGILVGEDAANFDPMKELRRMGVAL